MSRRAGRTAFVFAGGSALASVQVGMLRPLLATGVRPDLVVGSSAGALNGAVTAADPGSAPDTLERLWTTARRSDVLPVRAPTVLRALAGRAPGFASAGGIRQVIERHLTVRRLEDTAIPLFVVAADLATREKVVLDRGDAVDALVATTAIPGVYPPVRIGDRLLADGGLAEEPPLGTAVERGATTVYLFPVWAGHWGRHRRRARSPGRWTRSTGCSGASPPPSWPGGGPDATSTCCPRRRARGS